MNKKRRVMQRLIERDGRLQVAGMFTRAQDAIEQW